MSFNQWKVLNNLKDTISKINNDKSIQNIVAKEALQIVQKLTTSLYNKNVGNFLETSSTGHGTKASTSKSEDSYLPAVLNDLRSKMGMSQEGTNKEIPKWKQKVLISEVPYRLENNNY